MVKINNLSVVIVVTAGEEVKLESSLKSIVGRCGEVVLVKNGDVKLSKEALQKCIVKKIDFTDYVEAVRQETIQFASNDWVFVLDPDESIPQSLWNYIYENIDKKYSGIEVPRKNIILGKWIKHTNWWPDRHVRIIKKSKIFWDDVIHVVSPRVEGDILIAPNSEKYAIVHNSYDSVSEFVERQNRYSDVESRQKFKLGYRFSFLLLLKAALRQILVRFIKHQGYKDGVHGFILVVLMIFYEFMLWFKIWELQRKKY